ncbi:hypothetical protein [Rhodomicrobium vannielii]|uniref:hypothetical protein n=1 Tax=Rhodomicrobium vannielii TaxID=1069 RepID=UPI00159546A4|nr:hypothetical protein [Rhodomicrobium vannielii]
MPGVERVFGTWKRCYGYRRGRFAGMARNAVDLDLLCIAFDVRRAVARRDDEHNTGPPACGCQRWQDPEAQNSSKRMPTERSRFMQTSPKGVPSDVAVGFVDLIE